MLEDLGDPKPLWFDNLTLKLAVEAMRAVEAVHAALVLHGDIAARNFLVVGERVVLVDFDSASSWPHDKAVTKDKMARESCFTWGLLFRELPALKVIQGHDRKLRYKLWSEKRSLWHYFGGGDEEPEPPNDDD